MMNDSDVCLFEFIGEVEMDQHTNLIFNVLALNVAIVMNLSNVENVHLLMFRLCNLHVYKFML
jgi:hypothetical protein